MKIKGWIIGGLIGLLVGSVKIIIHGGTFLEFSTEEAIYSILTFPIYGAIFGYMIDKLKISNIKKLYKSIYIVILSSLLITVYPIILQLLNKDVETISALSLLTSFLFIFIAIIVLVIILILVIKILSYLLKRKYSYFNTLNLCIIWLTSIFFLINDMGENFNFGGSNGRWYLYGDLLFLCGILLIIILGFKNE